MSNDTHSPFPPGRSNSGSLPLTHQYLLAGDAAPLLLAPAASADDTDDSDATAAALLAGVIAVGVGDAAASAADVAAHGRARWPGRSALTLEGSAAALGAMLAATYGLRAAATATATATAQCGSLCARRRRRRLRRPMEAGARSPCLSLSPYTAAPQLCAAPVPRLYTLRAALICTHVRTVNQYICCNLYSRTRTHSSQCEIT